MCSSKTEGPKRETALVDNRKHVEEVSTGTHFIEFHMPSAGYGFGFFLVVLAVVYLIMRCKQRRRTTEQRMIYQEMAGMAAMAAATDSFPGIRFARGGVQFHPHVPLAYEPRRPLTRLPSIVRRDRVENRPESRFEDLGTVASVSPVSRSVGVGPDGSGRVMAE